MSGPTPSMAPGQPTLVPVDPSSGLWERLTHWASENKTVVYTIAGVGIAVTGAGVIYYLNDNVCLRRPHDDAVLNIVARMMRLCAKP
jgi:import receptor subunit TOM70